MKKILGLHLNGCPYCANAFRAIEELKKENSTYGTIEIEWVEDQNAVEFYKTHPYDYYPNMWVEDTKLYEAHPGETYAQTKEFIKGVFDKVLA